MCIIPFTYFLWWNVYSGLLTFAKSNYILIIELLRIFYISSNSLCQIYALHTFSPILWLVFIFLTLTFEEQNLSIWMAYIQQLLFSFSFFWIGVFNIYWLQLPTFISITGSRTLQTSFLYIKGTWAFGTFASASLVNKQSVTDTMFI